MSEKNTSYKYNKNKEEPKIIFEEFPYDENGKIKKEEKNKNNGIYTFAVIFIIITLFIISSILNQVILYSTESNNYKTINKFNGDYATIILSDRENLFKKIGFVSIYQKKENINGKITDITYASNKVVEPLVNNINVYYDENSVVKYVNLNLAYNKNKFSISKITSDCNAILNNFVNIKVTKKVISKVKQNKYYNEDIKNNISLTYKITKEINDYYMLNVIIQNKSSN